MFYRVGGLYGAVGVKIGILGVEIGVALAVMAVMCTVFFAIFTAEESPEDYRSVE